MEMIKVGIFLDDELFARALSMGLARECRNMNFLLLKNLEDGAMCDLILSSIASDDNRTIALVRDEKEENIYGSPPYQIYRYKESRHLVNDLLFIFFKISGENLEFTGDTKCHILVFASVAGGCGCTALAISTGKVLYKLYGCKCLYLNLCPLDDSKKYLPADGKVSLLSLLYYLDTKKDFPLGTFLSYSEQIDFIQTSLLNSYFDELHPSLLNQLIQKIDELGNYSFLILDISNHFSRSNKQLLSRASQIVLLSKEHQLSTDYYLNVAREIEAMAKGVRILTVENYTENMEDEVYFQTETGIIAKKIMEEAML